MAIDIKHIARLARLSFDPAETEKFQKEMADIVAMCENLPPMEDEYSALDPAHPMALRADQVRPSYKRDEILKNAPAVEAGCVSVPKIVE